MRKLGAEAGPEQIDDAEQNQPRQRRAQRGKPATPRRQACRQVACAVSWHSQSLAFATARPTAADIGTLAMAQDIHGEARG